MNQVADRYAEAFFSLASEEKKTAQLKAEAVSFNQTVSRDLIRFLESKFIGKEDKIALLKEVTKGGDPDLTNLLCLLVDSSRTHYLKDILNRFIELCNEELGVQVVKVVSARELNKEELDKIKEAIKTNLNKEVEIVTQIDSDLLAGTRIYINDRVYDSSLSSRIGKMREELLKESW